MRIAIIGSGIAGLTAAHLLYGHHDVQLFEADDRLGGHTNTVRVELPNGPVEVDTGFLVYNDRTYPRFGRLLAQLGVATQASDMSFGVRDAVTGVEWRGTNLASVFAQPRNVVRPGFMAMLADVARFNRLARRLLSGADDPGSLADLLDGHRWSRQFLDWYLVPLGSAIWSADPTTFTRIPARTFAEFFSRHGLLRMGDQPAWRTVSGGAAHYVRAISAPLRVHTATPVGKLRRMSGGVELLLPTGPELFDHVVVATHSDQALELLGDATAEERRVLGALRYQPNQATLHTDTTLMPNSRRAWASWNYHRPAHTPERATLTYLLNTLQGLDVDRPLLVTLNRDDEIDPAAVLARFDYAHPVVDLASVAAQSDQLALSAGDVSYCGAYWGYGFHEDGVASAVAVCRRLGGRQL